MISPRSLLAALLALSAACAARTRADDTLPTSQPAGRYEMMAARSPFMAPSAPTPVVAPPPAPAGPHWWDQLVVTSLMEENGVYIAALVDHANGKRYVLETGKVDDSQLLLAGVQWNEHAAQSTVTVSRGSEIAPPLRFENAGAPAATSPDFSSQMDRKHNPSLPPGFSPPPPPPSAPNVVRRNPIAAKPPPPAQPARATPNPASHAADRRSIRPLNGEN